jgi:NAD+ kinase
MEILVEKVGILYHPKVEATLNKAQEIEQLIASKDVPVWLCSAWEHRQACDLIDGTGLVLTVGGDGTILRAVQAVIPSMIPITGINLGTLGFMTELDAGEALEKLPALLEGQGWIDERYMLQAEISGNGGKPQIFHALNDVVVARGAIARAVNISVVVDGQRLADYRADGLILSTATGSTGYAMAAGGPIIYPASSDMLLAPVAPHLTSLSPVVLPGTTVVELSIDTYLAATLSIDGHINLPLSGSDVVKVSRSPYRARFLRLRPGESIYSSLEAKLRGRQSGSGRKS